MHPVQVVSRAEADQVRRLVGAAARSEHDVVRMRRGATAAWHPAEAPVARQYLLLQRRTVAERRSHVSMKCSDIRSMHSPAPTKRPPRLRIAAQAAANKAQT